MKGRHAQSRDPRAHWLLLAIVIPAMFAILLFEGWTTNEVAVAKTRSDCTTPVPNGVEKGGPVLRINGDKVTSASMPARTVALTFDGGPDPVWTPRLLDLLRKNHAHATFFLIGAQAARHPDLVQRIRAEGHEIGVNTYTGADMGADSAFRDRMELGFTQTAMAGSAGIHVRLLRMPQTTAVDTLCGAEWKAAQRAAADGYVVVAADQYYRKPVQGLVRQYSQTEVGYQEAEKLLADRTVARFTTVSAGIGLPSADTPISAVERWKGTALV